MTPDQRLLILGPRSAANQAPFLQASFHEVGGRVGDNRHPPISAPLAPHCVPQLIPGAPQLVPDRSRATGPGSCVPFLLPSPAPPILRMSPGLAPRYPCGAMFEQGHAEAVRMPTCESPRRDVIPATLPTARHQSKKKGGKRCAALQSEPERRARGYRNPRAALGLGTIAFPECSFAPTHIMPQRETGLSPADS